MKRSSRQQTEQDYGNILKLLTRETGILSEFPALPGPADVVDPHHHDHGRDTRMAENRHVEAAESVRPHSVRQHPE